MLKCRLKLLKQHTFVPQETLQKAPNAQSRSEKMPVAYLSKIGEIAAMACGKY